MIQYLKDNGGKLPDRFSDTDPGYYISFNKYDKGIDAQNYLQLPNSVLSLPPPQYRIHISTSNITDDLRIPYNRLEEDNFLEPLAKAYPVSTYGPGGGTQALRQKGFVVDEVWDISVNPPQKVYP